MADDYSWIGPLIGAVGGYLGSRGGGDTTTTTNQLPAQFQPLAAGVAQRGIDIGNMPYTPYTGDRVAGFSPYQFAGMDQIAGNAMGGGQQLANAAQSNLTGTLQGNYLSGNPYLDKMVSQTAGDVQGRLNAQAFNGGSFGNAGIAQAGAQGIANAENSLRYGAYNDERARQMQGLGLANQVQAGGYMPGQQLMGIGATMQQQGQNVLDSNYNQFQDWLNWPFKTYDAMMAPFGRNIGSSSTTTGPAPNTAAGMLGGAMLGGRIQQGWGSGNWGGSPMGQPNAGPQQYPWG